MQYEGSVYRPPSEAYSLIVQVTIGCSHNQCTFCSMYKDKKFRIRSVDAIKKDLIDEAPYGQRVKRIFLADGNALAMATSDLKEILCCIKKYYPNCKRVGVYAAPKDALRKSAEELKELRELGIGIAYLGLESGSEVILKEIKKGVQAEEMVVAEKKRKEAGIELSVTLISGLGGRNKIEEHAFKSAKVLNEMQPNYLGLLTLLIQEGTIMFEQVKSGEMELLKPQEVIHETYLLIQNLEQDNCIFRSNHASNYYSLEGNLPQDKEKLLNQLEELSKENYSYKDEWVRRL